MKQPVLNLKRPWIYIVGLLLLAGGGAALAWQLSRTTSENASHVANPSLIDGPTLNGLARTQESIDQTHLAKGLTPPTNKWFSGFALQTEPKPGYNYPTSFKPHDDGFEFSLPQVNASKSAITGPHAPDVVVTIAGADSYKITDYDELVVELTYYTAAGEAIATVRVASGLPYVYLSALHDSTVKVSGNTSSHGSWTSIQQEGRYYGVTAASQDGRFNLSADSNATFFSAPSKDTIDTVRSYANAAVKSGDVSYERQNDAIETIITYQSTNGQPVLFGRLPHQQSSSDSKATYQSILGDITTEAGTSFSFTTPALPVTETLDLSGISDENRTLLVEQLRKDIATFAPKPDTYFGGKQLYRMAQLLMIANELQEDELAATAQKNLKQELESWLTLGKNESKSFLYDSGMHGIIGNEASFGSDKEFNDHHFHYGYFIYAAAVLAQHDESFLNTHTDTVNLLVADIANYNADEALPLRRSFDPYAGHSWASGTMPFTDGNNQESTSEAINAWVGVSLWASRINNQALKLQADWMLSQEYATAQQYWLLQGGSTPDYLVTYDSPLVSIVWGGKREYSTFFSDEANAKLAIQLLPLSPAMQRVDTPLPESLFAGTAVDQPYGDYILMARSSATLEKAINLPDTAIDDGNSRTYMYAYILSK